MLFVAKILQGFSSKSADSDTGYLCQQKTIKMENASEAISKAKGD